MIVENKKEIVKARKKRIKDRRKQIESAIDILIIENKKLTTYSVAKRAGISYNTINKNEEIKNMIKEAEQIRIKIFLNKCIGNILGTENALN